MHQVNLRNFDLNLLVVLDRLLEERHVSRAAQGLHMSQPAVSRALTRLRDGFKDPLLVRTGDGYDLSARALALKAPLKAHLKQLEELISQPQFDPAMDDHLIRITGLDMELSLYIPKLIRLLRQQAPYMRFEILRQEGDSFNMLDRDEADFCLSGIAPGHSESRLHRFHVDQMPIVCVMDAKHPLANRPLTIKDYITAPHGLVSITGKGPGFMDKVLAEQGYQRQVMVRLAGFNSVAEYCSGSNLLFTLPQRVAERIAAEQPIWITPLPKELNLPKVNFYWYWHERNHQDLRCMWIREEFQKVLKEMGHSD